LNTYLHVLLPRRCVGVPGVAVAVGMLLVVLEGLMMWGWLLVSLLLLWRGGSGMQSGMHERAPS